MAKQSRRDFLKTASFIGISAAGLSTKTKAEEKFKLSEDRIGVLVDSTKCIGCRSCEWACKEEHNLPNMPLENYHNDRSVFEKERRPSDKALTVVNEFKVAKLNIDVKVQCMHCEDPACVSACIVHAFTKTPEGPVIWDTNKCIGCRYCMVACPFQIPVFEYSKAIAPNILKCDFCYTNRTSKGRLPACVEACPVEALTFGKRKDLVEVAHNRIKEKPDKYFDHVYGEHEVGGTSWLYLSPVDFKKIDFPVLDTEPAPGVTKEIQHGIFRYFVPPVALYALLGGIMWITKPDKEKKKGEV